MGNKKLKNRNEIDKKYKWNIEAMYADANAWEKDIQLVLEMTHSFSKYQGKLTESAKTLAEAMNAKDAIWQKLERLCAYEAR